MISLALGLATTGWSAVRSSRVAQYALIAAAILLAILIYGRGKKKQGAAEAVARATVGVVKRMERNREIHRHIQSWPLDRRARKLRELDAAR
jgi:Na+/H+ antiporter NhaC